LVYYKAWVAPVRLVQPPGQIMKTGCPVSGKCSWDNRFGRLHHCRISCRPAARYDSRRSDECSPGSWRLQRGGFRCLERNPLVGQHPEKNRSRLGTPFELKFGGDRDPSFASGQRLCHNMPVGYAHILPLRDADTLAALRRDAVPQGDDMRTLGG